MSKGGRTGVDTGRLAELAEAFPSLLDRHFLFDSYLFNFSSNSTITATFKSQKHGRLN